MSETLDSQNTIVETLIPVNPKETIVPVTETIPKLPVVTKGDTFGVRHRTAMGDYKPKPNGHQLSHLANPTPGPLDYEPKLVPSGCQYSILGKHEGETKANIGPGPNKYDIRNTTLVFDKPPLWSLGKKQSDSIKMNDFPSPFTYDPKTHMFGKDSVSCKFSGRHYFKRILLLMIEIITPGPDRYFPRVDFGPSPKYSFGTKRIEIEEATPGPLDYNVPSIRLDAPKGPAFSMRQKFDEPFHKPNNVPGPDSYYPKAIVTEKMASLKGMPKEPKMATTPGPANYIINSALSTPQYTLTARNIPYQDEEYIGPNPGPADYKPTHSLTRNSIPKFSLGHRLQEKQSDNHVPGPNSYHPKHGQIKINQNPKVSIKGRYKTKSYSTPGPADYNSHLAASTPNAAEIARNVKKMEIGNERFKSVIEDSPGPADYEIKNFKKRGPSYSLRKRLDTDKVINTPGPNAYDASPSSESPKITMKSRFSPFVLVFPSNRIDTIRVSM